MANFHDNVLSIAANENDMASVLRRMALNLDANRADTGFDAAHIESCEDVPSLYGKLYYTIDAFYMEALAATPQGRGMSETASVGMLKAGDVWLLSIRYATANDVNWDDLNQLFQNLPQGHYGVALIDGDEYDRYATINTFAAIHHGRAPLDSLSMLHEYDEVDITDLKVRSDEAAGVLMRSTDNYAEMAVTNAIFHWSEWQCIEDSLSDDEIMMSEREDMLLYYVRRVTAAFPLSCSVTGASKLGRRTRIDQLQEGDELIVAAVLDIERHDATKLEVFNKSGKTIGELETTVDRAAVAALLPYVRASVQSITPPSERVEGSRTAPIKVRLELNLTSTATSLSRLDSRGSVIPPRPIPGEEIEKAVKRLLALPPAERITMSKCDIPLHSLQGEIDVTGAQDKSNR